MSYANSPPKYMTTLIPKTIPPFCHEWQRASHGEVVISSSPEELASSSLSSSSTSSSPKPLSSSSTSEAYGDRDAVKPSVMSQSQKKKKKKWGRGLDILSVPHAPTYPPFSTTHFTLPRFSLLAGQQGSSTLVIFFIFWQIQTLISHSLTLSHRYLHATISTIIFPAMSLENP